MHDAAISIDLLKNAGTWEINAIQSQIFYLMMFSTFQISTSNFNRPYLPELLARRSGTELADQCLYLIFLDLFVSALLI